MSVAGERVIVPTHRGNSEIFLLLGKSGDFLVCDSNHRLVYKKDGKFYAEPVTELTHRSELAPLHDKSAISWKKFFTTPVSTAASELILLCKKEQEIVKGDKEIAARFFKLALTGHKFDCDDYVVAGSLRTLGTIYGYNVVAKPTRTKVRYKVRFTRKSTTKINRVILTGRKEEIGTCTVVNKEPFYANQGFYQRNTGGDMIRRDLIMFYQLDQDDKEYHDNAIICSTVHDEINWYCKRSYLPKLVKHIKRIMTYDDKGNWPIPIEVSIGVSPTDWGTCLDCDDVSDDGKLIIKEFEGVEPKDFD